MSVDKTLHIVKSSIGQVTGQPPHSRSFSSDEMGEVETRRSNSERESWEDEVVLREGEFCVLCNVYCMLTGLRQLTLLFLSFATPCAMSLLQPTTGSIE
jgi:hypothetical protein